MGTQAARLARWTAFIALLLLGFSLFAHTIIDTDIWWHLRTGRYIVETGNVPDADMYSYTAGGNEWIDTHWLFQVIIFETQHAFGAYGLSILFILIYCSVFGLLWAACDDAKAGPVALVFFWLALMAAAARFLARPEAFTYLMISIYTLLLLRFEQGRSHWWSLFVLIPLQALWANLQGLFILGPFLIGAYAAQQVALVAVGKALKKEPDTEITRKGILLIVVLVGATIACLLNPYGIRGLLFPFTLFTRAGGMQNVFASSIAELQPPFSGYNLTLPLKFLAVFMTLCAVVLVLDFRKLKLSHVAVFVGTGYLALNARRNAAIFVLAMLPIAVCHADELTTRLRKMLGKRRERAFNWASIVACGAIVAVVIFQIFGIISGRFYIADKRGERFGFGFKGQTFPHGAFVFIKENEIAGPFFNNMDIGGMFIWELYPKEKVFIDARLEVNSAEAFTEYRRAASDPKEFAQLAGRRAFNAAVVSHTSQDGLNMMPLMRIVQGWTLVYLDPIAAVFARNAGPNAVLISRYGIDLTRDHIDPLAPNDTLNDGGPLFLENLLGGFSTPKDAEAQNCFNLGLVFFVNGLYERAVDQLKAGLELMPLSPEGHYNLALAYERMRRMQEAVAGYQKAIELNPRHAGAHSNLGRIYDDRGLKDKAEEEYRRAIRWGGGDPIPLYNLGALCHERGDREAARKYWRRALKVDPSFTPAKEALGMAGD